MGVRLAAARDFLSAGFQRLSYGPLIGAPYLDPNVYQLSTILTIEAHRTEPRTCGAASIHVLLGKPIVPLSSPMVLPRNPGSQEDGWHRIGQIAEDQPWSPVVRWQPQRRMGYQRQRVVCGMITKTNAHASLRANALDQGWAGTMLPLLDQGRLEDDGVFLWRKIGGRATVLGDHGLHQQSYKTLGLGGSIQFWARRIKPNIV